MCFLCKNNFSWQKYYLLIALTKLIFWCLMKISKLWHKLVTNSNKCWPYSTNFFSVFLIIVPLKWVITRQKLNPFCFLTSIEIWNSISYPNMNLCETIRPQKKFFDWVFHWVRKILRVRHTRETHEFFFHALI